MRTIIRFALFLVLSMAATGTAIFADDQLPSTRLFQVIMIEAATTESLMPEGIPQSAMRALDDMKDFLPYKGYRLIDSALVRTAHSASTSLKGVEGSRYEVDLTVMGPEGDGDPDLFFRRFSIRLVPDKITVPEPSQEPAGGISGSEKKAPRAPRGSRVIIQTSFGMNIGETVIVGSSRLNGDTRALIALVTALP